MSTWTLQLTLLSVVAWALPFVVYVVSRWSGSLPDEAQWVEMGSNHGPWRWEWQMFLIGYPLLLLAVLTIGTCVFRTVRSRAIKPLLTAAILVVAQLLAAASQLVLLGWTID